jgi:hypothetical protein
LKFDNFANEVESENDDCKFKHLKKEFPLILIYFPNIQIKNGIFYQNDENGMFQFSYEKLFD